jgi:hypothetical protein
VLVQVDVLIPSKNGSVGAFIAARVDRGGCDAASATGVFFTIFPENGTFEASTDLGMSWIVCLTFCALTCTFNRAVVIVIFQVISMDYVITDNTC